MNYRIGLDIGIGSIGWAVISGKDATARIEDFGVRIFESGEGDKKSGSECRQRRGFRSVRRLERRRSYRKMLLRNHFENIGMINAEFEDDLAECKDADVYLLKIKGLDEQLTPAELYKCLVHTCNHRGYRDFYESDDSDDGDDESEEGVNKQAASEFDKKFAESGKRTVSEYLVSCCTDGKFVNYRNNAGGQNEYLLVRRNLLQDEAEKILANQQKYYDRLTNQNIDTALNIMFNQRAFEDGPGDKNDPTRRYKGFLESIGQCPFFKDQKRGFRGTVIGDVYAAINTLSQYRYVNTVTGEYVLDASLAEALVKHILDNGQITMTAVKQIAKQYKTKVIKSEGCDEKALGKSFRTLKSLKSALEACGENWQDWIGEEQFDLENASKLHQIAEILSKYQTPKYRLEQLKKLSFLNGKLLKRFSELKMGGTARTSYEYMINAIKAFTEGDIYGNYQAKLIKEQASEKTEATASMKMLPSAIDDSEVRDNPVVFKAVNETRKIINAIVAQYGSPDEMVIEVADELGKSFAEREEIEKRKRENEKNNDAIRADIVKILGYNDGNENKVTAEMIDCYKLYRQQEGKDPYSGVELGELADVLHNSLKQYEIDHIVPYSLILDNTLNNKVLVHASENQRKGQRTPLMYLSEEKKEQFLTFVNHMYARDNEAKGKVKGDIQHPPVNAKKLAYFKLPDIYSKEAQELLSDWKSRNLNDTRYITKYIVGLVSSKLKFTSAEGKNVFGIKGAVTSRFRRIWLVDTPWGDEEKNRSTYLNHAIDAVIIANLTPPYIEIASDAVKLRALYKKFRFNTEASEYKEYFEKCLDKMQKYYGFSKEYTKKLLINPEVVPSYVPDLKEEVMIRFNDTDPEKFAEETEKKYGKDAHFTVPLQMPITSHKQNLKFKGCIADSNPIRVIEIDGDHYKISRRPIQSVKADDIPKLYTGDVSLVETLKRIFEGQDSKYTVEKYMKENNLSAFVTDSGQPVRKVSLIEGKVSNYYTKQMENGNHTNLGMPKYYCIEVYKDCNGKTRIWGIRYVDIIRKDKKLFVKKSMIPADYSEHSIYIYPLDYLVVLNNKNDVKYSGYFKSVYNINQNALRMTNTNASKSSKDDEKALIISQGDTVKKVNISILGKKGGMIHDVPYPCCE